MGVRCMRKFGKLLWKNLKIQLNFSPICTSIITLLYLPRFLSIEFESNPTVLEKSIVFFLVILLTWATSTFISVILCSIIEFIIDIDE